MTDNQTAALGVINTTPKTARVIDAPGDLYLLDVPDENRHFNIMKEMERAAGRPDRITGTSQHSNLASLAAHATRFRDQDSGAFIDQDLGKITVIYNYDEPPVSARDIDAAPRWRDHRAEWALSSHEAWTRWTGLAGEWLDAKDFAEHLEASALDLIPKPDLEDASTPADLVMLAKRLRVNYGDPDEILNVAKSFKVNASVEIEQAQTLQSGEMQVSFKESHTPPGGGKVTVPGLFLIALHRFEGDPNLYRIPVKLRYATRGGGVKWRYELHQQRAIDRAAWMSLGASLANLVERPATPQTTPDGQEIGKTVFPTPPPFPIFYGAPEHKTGAHQ